jgi:hypothetical protein
LSDQCGLSQQAGQFALLKNLWVMIALLVELGADPHESLAMTGSW